MATTWTAPTDVIALTPASSAAFNTEVLDNLRYLADDHAVCLRLSSDQSIPSATPTLVLWDVDAWNSAAMWSLGTQTDVLIVEDGRYDVRARIKVNSNATGSRTVDLRLDAGGSASGGTRLDSMIVSASTVGDQRIELGCMAELAAGQVVQVFVTQTSGSSRLLLSGEDGCQLSLTRLRAAGQV